MMIKGFNNHAKTFQWAIVVNISFFYKEKRRARSFAEKKLRIISIDFFV